MRLKNKIIISFVFSVICIVFFKSNSMYALTQEEAGKYIAEFSINYFNDYGNQTTYSWNFAQRAAACRGEKTSGMAGAPTPYYFEDFYAVDCVGWVSMAIYQSLKLYRPDIVDTGATGYVVPTKYGNNYKPEIMEEVKDRTLRPGDILANSHHVMVYVGNIGGQDRIVHSVSRFHLNYNTFAEYAAMNKSAGSDIRGVYEKVYRIKEEAAQKVKESDATTIFKGSGGITNKWGDSASTSSSEATQNGRVVDVEDKLPLYKHILLTEKYNFNNIKWKRYGHGYDGQDCSMKENLNLGLKYPSDEANTELNAFIDFSLPYLQTWMIPLSMNAGALTQGTQSNTINNPMFPYLTIKKAMSKIISHRYDITTCVLTTKYRDYDVYKVTEVYNVTYDENGALTSISKSESKKEFVEHKSEPEQDVGTKIDVEPSYYIKQALTFDRKISNEFNYIKYSDDDVKNKVEGGTGFIGKELRDGEAINEEGASSKSSSDGKLYITYEKREGKYIYVDRTWKDELEVSDPKSEPYDVQDVQDYNLKDEDSESGSVVTDSNGTNQTVQYKGKTITYSAKFASETKSPEELGLKFEKITNGETTNYDGCRVCNENVNQIGNTGIKLNLGRKIVARWSKDSFVDYGDWVYIPGWGYALVADCGGFTGKASDKYHLDCFVGEEGDVIDDGQGNYSALKRRCINWKGVYERAPGSKTDVTIYRIKAEDIPQELLGEDDNSTDSENNSNENNNDSSQSNTEETKNSNEFSSMDLDYYKILKLDNEINRVDIMNSKPKNYLEYIKKGTEYSEHVGYSRTYITFAYSNLRRLFDEYFGSKGTVPFAYGTTLGYNIYTGTNEIKGGKYNILDEGSGSSGVGRKVFISPSNQLDNILTGINKSEHEVTLGISNKLKSILESRGYNVGMDMDPNNSGKIGKNPTSGKAFLGSKEEGIYIAIHTNAGGGSGPETYYNENEELAKKLAQNINDGLFKIYSDTFNGSKKTSTNRGIKTSAEGNINEIKSTKDFYSILTEIAFGDNAQEAQWILDNTDKIAENLADSIDQFFNENMPKTGNTSQGGSYDWDSGGLQQFDYAQLPGEEMEFELSFYCGVDNTMEGGPKGTHENILVYGNVASNYWSGMSSKGGWHNIENGRNIGTKIYLDGIGLFTVEDRGGSNDFNGKTRIDVFVKRKDGESDSAYEARTNSYGHVKIKGKVLPAEYDSHQHSNPDTSTLNLK